MLGAAAVGLSVTGGRFQVPKWNSVGEFRIFNANHGVTPPANPQWDNYVPFPPELPQNEEFQVQLSNTLATGTEIENVVVNIAPDDWALGVERGEMNLCVRGNSTINVIANAWSGAAPLLLAQSLRGGVYVVTGCTIQGGGIVAYRLIFPRNKLYHGRRLRPGGLAQFSIGDALTNNVQPWLYNWGIMGAFHTFELPSIEVFGTATVSSTYPVHLWLTRIGEPLELLNRYTQ
jgi:hypothetical protein